MVILRTLSQVDGAAPATPLGDRFEVDAVPLSTACAGCDDVGLVLIGRAQGFFGRQPPRRLAAFQISPVLSAIPCSASSQAWSWASVIPGRTMHMRRERQVLFARQLARRYPRLQNPDRANPVSSSDLSIAPPSALKGLPYLLRFQIARQSEAFRGR